MVRIHGRWCGPNWTDGRVQSAREYKLKGGTFKTPCDDKLDCACRTHDKECSGKDGCTSAADTKLMKAAQKYLDNTLNAIAHPIIYSKARVIRDGMSVTRLTRGR
jgi:hypothetical protein